MVEPRWQHAVLIQIGAERLPLSLDETREIIAKLREPDRGNPHMHDAQIAAAIHLERLADELDAHNPPLTDREVRALGLALTRLEITAGLSDRQRAVRDAILAHERRRSA